MNLTTDIEKKEKEKYKNDPLGTKVKTWEDNTPEILPNHNWTIIRIDGHCFHTFTKGFNRPCDNDLSDAMIATTKDLCKMFNAVTGYTQSDEITLLLLPTEKDLNGKHFPMIYNGRKQKLVSLTASYAAARFNHYLSLQSKHLEDTKSIKYKKMISGDAYFDSRAITLDDIKQVVDVFFWRYHFDCYRNGISALAQSFFSHKQLFHKNTTEKLNMLKEKNIDINSFPLHLLFGTFIKKQTTRQRLLNRKTNQEEDCLRNHYVCVTLQPPIEDFDLFLTNKILSSLE